MEASLAHTLPLPLGLFAAMAPKKKKKKDDGAEDEDP